MLRHLKYGTTKLDWFQGGLNEAKYDPIGFWMIVMDGRGGYGLNDGPLEQFVFDFIVVLLQGGAIPVIGDSTRASGWSPVYKYGQDPQAAASEIVREWRDSQGDPDVEDIWFALPEVVE